MELEDESLAMFAFTERGGKKLLLQLWRIGNYRKLEWRPVSLLEDLPEILKEAHINWGITQG